MSQQATLVENEESAKQSLKDFSEDTTLHGLRNTTRGGSLVARVFWILVLVGVLAVLLYFLTSIFIKALKPQMMTETIVSFDDAAIPFPSVTICNFNQVRRSFARANPLIKTVLTEWFAKYDAIMRSIVADNQNLTELFPDIVQQNDTYWSLDMSEFNITEIRELFLGASQPLTNFIYDVHFANEKILQEDVGDYFKPVITDMGMCYTFRGYDGNKLIRVNDVGADFGLKLSLHVETDEYFVSPDIRFEEGVVVAVHEHEDDVPSMLTEGIMIEPRAAAGIALSRHKFEYDSSVTDCIDTKSKTFKNPLSSQRYTKEACLKECKTDYLHRACNCKWLYSSDTGPYCFDNEYYRCLNYAIYNFSVNDDGRKECKCPKTCDEMSFKATVSNSKYFNAYIDEAYLDYASGIENTNWANTMMWYRNRFMDSIRLSVFFRDLSLTTTRQISSYSFNDAWSDIGGCLGLCFGASLFTLMEIGAFCVIYTFQMISKWHQRGKTNPESNQTRPDGISPPPTYEMAAGVDTNVTPKNKEQDDMAVQDI